MGKSIKELFEEFFGNEELKRLRAENAKLRDHEKSTSNYIRRKVNQLLLVMGTLPLRVEELDDHSLVELDPIGIVADAFEQILENHHATNERLNMAREETQAILAAAGTAIMVVNDKMRIEICNLKARELFPEGMTQEEIIGQPCYKLLCNLNHLPEDCTFEAVSTSRGAICRHDWYLQSKERWFDVYGAPIKNKYGDITSVVLVYNDISIRKGMEEALRDSEAMYKSLFENTTDLIQSVSPDGSFRYVNPSWVESLGYSEDDLVGLKLIDILHSDSRDHCLNFFQKLMKGEQRGHVDVVFVCKDGTSMPVSGNVSCTYADGRPVMTYGIFRKNPGAG